MCFLSVILTCFAFLEPGALARDARRANACHIKEQGGWDKSRSYFLNRLPFRRHSCSNQKLALLRSTKHRRGIYSSRSSGCSASR